MAVVADTTSTPRVLAVDSSRLAAVARWRPEYGPAGALAAAVADEPGPAALPGITGDHLTVRVRLGGAAPAALTLALQGEETAYPSRSPSACCAPASRP